ncbi:peptidase, partial [Pseudomonas syringae]
MTTLPIPVMDAAAQRDLARAHALLENPGVAAQLANALGAPIESLITKRLPKVVTRSIDGVTRRALQVAMKSALLSLRGKADAQQPASTTRHTLAVAVSGGAGGFFGLPGLMVELPVTTTVM